MNLLVISGGRHPYEESTPVLEEFLKAAGHDLTVTDDASVLADSDKMGSYDALVFNTLRAGENGLSKNEQAGMTSFIEAGKGFVCIHISGCSSDDWPQYYDITGGGWITGESWHPPFGWFQVFIDNPDHPVADGVSDFWTYDECYCGLDIQPGIDVFMHGVVEGENKPLGWSHQYGDGKVVNIALGHAGSSQQHPLFQKLILNALDYLS